MRVLNEKCAVRFMPGIVFHTRHFSDFCVRHAVFVRFRFDDFSGFRSSSLRFVPRWQLFSVVREVDVNDVLPTFTLSIVM